MKKTKEQTALESLEEKLRKLHRISERRNPKIIDFLRESIGGSVKLSNGG